MRPVFLFAAFALVARSLPAQQQTHAMDSVLVKDWVPDSSLRVPITNIPKARFPAIDLHVHVGMPGTNHTGGDTPESLAAWVKNMDESGVEKAIVLTEAIGAEFDRLADLYRGTQPGRFQLWCGLDIRDFEQPGYPERAAAELERCYRKGARGVGELTDKGYGLSGDTSLPRANRLHPDD